MSTGDSGANDVGFTLRAELEERMMEEYNAESERLWCSFCYGGFRGNYRGSKDDEGWDKDYKKMLDIIGERSY